MIDFCDAMDIIKKYEGFSEKALADPSTGKEPFSIGYGTQFYPDGEPVKKGQLCTERKALEYLLHEVNEIDNDLKSFNLGLEPNMTNALISFIHSVGWDLFLKSRVIEYIVNEKWKKVAQEMTAWVIDGDYRIIGSLIDRRREESLLFLKDVGISFAPAGELLLNAFRQYQGTIYQQKAIQMLEENTNPYVLSEFANKFSAKNFDEFFENHETHEYTAWD